LHSAKARLDSGNRFRFARKFKQGGGIASGKAGLHISLIAAGIIHAFGSLKTDWNLCVTTAAETQGFCKVEARLAGLLLRCKMGVGCEKRHPNLCHIVSAFLLSLLLRGFV
jgi:hypothetical protein